MIVTTNNRLTLLGDSYYWVMQTYQASETEVETVNVKPLFEDLDEENSSLTLLKQKRKFEEVYEQEDHEKQSEQDDEKEQILTDCSEKESLPAWMRYMPRLKFSRLPIDIEKSLEPAHALRGRERTSPQHPKRIKYMSYSIEETSQLLSFFKIRKANS